MGQITGRVTIRVDGKEFKSMNGATGTVGGENREVVKGGGRIHGYKSEDQEPVLSIPLAHDKNVSLRELSDINDATAIMETDTGVQFIYRGAFTTEPPELAADTGTITLKMAALTCDEL